MVSTRKEGCAYCVVCVCSETPGPSGSSSEPGETKDGASVDMVGAHENVSTTVVVETSAIQAVTQANRSELQCLVLWLMEYTFASRVIAVCKLEFIIF